MDLGTALIASALIILAFQTGVFLIATGRKDNGTQDIFYGLGFLASAYLIAYIVPGIGALQIMVLAILTAWALRLSLRIFLKNIGRPEDFRYRAWREAWMQKGGFRYFLARSYFQIYLLQGAVIWLVSLPITLVVATVPQAPGALAWIGLAVWVAGFLLESAADMQLDQFLANPENRGRIMTQGLFRFSRRPNYFGETLMWWGMAIIALSVPVGYLGFLSPLIITYVVVFVTGPMLEKKWEKNPEYAAYKARTSFFVPLPSRRAPVAPNE